MNHEFMAVADVGEDLFVDCENGDYLADIEAATPQAPARAAARPPAPLTEVATPGRRHDRDRERAARDRGRSTP